MSISAPVSKTACRLLLPLAVILLAGCQTSQAPLAVISSPTPFFGSAPISAYDPYAWAIQPRVGTPRAENAILISSR